MHQEMFERYDGFECLAESMVGSTYYAAVRSLKTGDVFALVCLTSTNKRDYYNFGYKAMDETSGPYKYSCPTKILKLLTPTNNETANEWRKACWEYHEKKAAPNAFKNLPEGTVVKWTVPHDRFTLCKKGCTYTLRKTRRNVYNPRSRFVWLCESPSSRWFISPKLVSANDYKIVGTPL